MFGFGQDIWSLIKVNIDGSTTQLPPVVTAVGDINPLRAAAFAHTSQSWCYVVANGVRINNLPPFPPLGPCWFFGGGGEITGNY